MNEDGEALYDATIVLTFPAEDDNDAMDQLDNLLDWLEETGYELGPATVEESVKLENA